MEPSTVRAESSFGVRNFHLIHRVAPKASKNDKADDENEECLESNSDHDQRVGLENHHKQNPQARGKRLTAF